jgi:putative DNA primase/helicase
VFDGDDELSGFVRRAVGYSITGQTSEQCFFILCGQGANGKSVLLEALRDVLGPYALDAGIDAFTDRPQHSESLAELAGRRFVTAAELREHTRLNEQRLKALAHGDTLSARFLYAKRFQFKPEGKIWLGLNHRPRVADDSVGFWRSVRLIPFRRQFLGAGADLGLTDKLRDESPGILAWAVRACCEWQQTGLGLPDAVVAATSEYEAEQDPLSEFLEACCFIGPDVQSSAKALWIAYDQWSDEQHVPQRERLTKAAFGRRLGERCEKKRIGERRVVTYMGLGLLSDLEERH